MLAGRNHEFDTSSSGFGVKVCFAGHRRSVNRSSASGSSPLFHRCRGHSLIKSRTSHENEAAQPAEPEVLSQDRLAFYANDNIFAKIYADQKAWKAHNDVASNESNSLLEGLDRLMAASVPADEGAGAPPQNAAKKSASTLVGIAAQFAK